MTACRSWRAGRPEKIKTIADVLAGAGQPLTLDGIAEHFNGRGPYRMKIPSLLAGVSGEYFVAAELSRRGHIASISLRNTRGIDILATNQAATRSITIQVKTNQLSRPTWVLSEKGEGFVSADHFYVLVILNALVERPAYYVVPSADVASYITTSHREWLASPGLHGKPHADSPMRKFADPAGQYLERWALLGL